jgi:hypothetical protein
MISIISSVLAATAAQRPVQAVTIAPPVKPVEAVEAVEPVEAAAPMEPVAVEQDPIDLAEWTGLFADAARCAEFLDRHLQRTKVCRELACSEQQAELAFSSKLPWSYKEYAGVSACLGFKPASEPDWARRSKSSQAKKRATLWLVWAARQ